MLGAKHIKQRIFLDFCLSGLSAFTASPYPYTYQHMG